MSKQKESSQSLQPWNRFSNLSMVVFLVVFGAVSALIVWRAQAEPKASNQVNLSLVPTSAQVAKGSTLSVSVWEDSQANEVNAVKAVLSYDPTQLQFVSADGASSQFEIEAKATGGNGVVEIDRGHIGQLSGKQLVSKVNFTALGSAGKANITFTNGSAVVSATENKDILAQTIGGRYTLSR